VHAYLPQRPNRPKINNLFPGDLPSFGLLPRIAFKQLSDCDELVYDAFIGASGRSHLPSGHVIAPAEPNIPIPAGLVFSELANHARVIELAPERKEKGEHSEDGKQESDNHHIDYSQDCNKYGTKNDTSSSFQVGTLNILITQNE
jgi:hypothetical protein